MLTKAHKGSFSSSLLRCGMEQKQQQRQRGKELSFLVIGCKCVVERLDRKREKSYAFEFPLVKWKLVLFVLS